MKRLKIKILIRITLSVLILSFFYSCTTTSKTATIDYDYVAKSGFLMAKPIVVDVDVESRKIEGKASVDNSVYKNNMDQAIKAAKNLAVMDAVEKGDADVIIQPIYETTSNIKTTTAIVSGYAGKYKEFRNLEDSDTTAFLLRSKMGGTTMFATLAGPEEVSISKDKKKIWPFIVIGIVLLGLAAGAQFIN